MWCRKTLTTPPKFGERFPVAEGGGVSSILTGGSNIMK